ncbi:TIGR04013 family B12-binding domain/radical SAM domain-containing protein [Atrimonas thermophila]|uniref:TIGR04013 family B12-binding domain/radical SAM domain-containing protein n=1 Tax=Atrimonas thermophila TaxID=3064161 RepID=UPI00399D3D03
MTKQKPALLVLYERPNRFSLNAILGAIGNRKEFNIKFCTSSEELYQVALSSSKALLLVSSMSKEWRERRALLQELREKNPHLGICVGGPHPSAKSADFEGIAHWIVKGEGEKTIAKVLQEWKEKPLPQTSRVLKGEPVVLGEYLPSPVWLGIFGPLEITRGCPFGCYFCQTSYLFGKKPRHRPLEAILEYARMMSKNNLTDIRFISPNALSYGSPDGKTLNLDACLNLLSGIRRIIGKRGRIFFGSFPSEVRPEFLNQEVARELKKLVDNRNLVIGAQSGSDRLLRTIGRGHSSEDVLQAAEAAASAGFVPIVDFIFGFPQESEEDFQRTVSLIEKLLTQGAQIHAHAFMPLPGTPFANTIPRRLTRKELKLLGNLARRGQLFGQWQTQQKIAEKMRGETIQTEK